MLPFQSDISVFIERIGKNQRRYFIVVVSVTLMILDIAPQIDSKRNESNKIETRTHGLAFFSSLCIEGENGF